MQGSWENTVKDSLTWLITIEQRAAAFYRRTADICAERHPEKAEFFSKLARDEDRHAEILHRYREIAEREAHPPSCIRIDDETRFRIQSALSACEADFSHNAFSLGTVLTCLIDLEFSELNDIFLYTITLLSDDESIAQDIAREIGEHRSAIEQFVLGVPDSTLISGRIASLRTPLELRMLVVDDLSPITDLLKAIFENSFLVDTAANGKEALQATCRHFYDVIISDIDMPVMNGIVFLEEAAKHDPTMNRRIIFFSGAITQKAIDDLKERHILFLLKPSSIGDIEAAVQEVLTRTGSGRLKSRIKRPVYNIP